MDLWDANKQTHPPKEGRVQRLISRHVHHRHSKDSCPAFPYPHPAPTSERSKTFSCVLTTGASVWFPCHKLSLTKPGSQATALRSQPRRKEHTSWEGDVRHRPQGRTDRTSAILHCTCNLPVGFSNKSMGGFILIWAPCFGELETYN